MGIRLDHFSLDDRFVRTSGHAYITGSQALLLMLIQQKRFDERRGLNTAGFLSGYRGSPLTSVDTDAWRAEKFLKANDITFVPSINEDIAATAVWGTQQAALDTNVRVGGVFAMWYGKGAGLDRCGDVMRHGHGSGSSPQGGVLVVTGDDHQLKSSSQAYHSEPTFVDLLMPVLYPANIEEMIQYGLLGWELSRYSGCWVGFKVLPETINSTTSIDLDISQFSALRPEDPTLSSDRNIRWPDPWPAAEKRLHEAKLPAALAFARANRIDRVAWRATSPDIAIVAPGKSYLDVLEALHTLGIDAKRAAGAGISLYKVGMPWPLEPEGLRSFLRGHRLVIVVEEKRDIIEAQLKSLLFHWSASERPVVIGRRDEQDAPLFPSIQEVTPEMIASVIVARSGERFDANALRARVALLDAKTNRVESPIVVRRPYFCSGCPHNTSTQVPVGSRALSGVGCHYMAVDMDRQTTTYTQMGGEGASWIGTAPFTNTAHIFANLGEGTYFHSGMLAIRACIAAGPNITYKILFNDAVAMTGGQPVDGELTVPQLTRQMRAEGVARIEVVTDDPHKYGTDADFAPGVRISARSELDLIQRELREVKGVSVLIYDQTCATEKRRRRKRGTMPDTGKRVFINEQVCEGCGDCGATSNCLSVVPVETEFGRKRMIDQSNCNQDFSCINGFCPSFVTITGAKPVKPEVASIDIDNLPIPSLPTITSGTSYDILVTGVGGTGIVTIGALLGTAAHLERKGYSVHDRLGMAQKYGTVFSHIRLTNSLDDLAAVRIPVASASLLIGGDLIATADPATLGLVDPMGGFAVVNTDQMITGDFPRQRDYDFRTKQLTARIRNALRNSLCVIDATSLSVALLGDAIGANLLLLGYAWQRGKIPISLDALHRAIEINGVAVAMSKMAFALGRKAAVDLSGLRESAYGPARATLPNDWHSMLTRRTALLTDYQNEKYAGRYRALVLRTAAAESRAVGHAGELTDAVARYFAKLMAYKDEYEVARLYANGAFADALKGKFQGGRMSVHLAPPLFAKKDRVTGHLRKREYGPWMFGAFAVLARLRRLRGTKFDIFGYTAERKAERGLIEMYEHVIDQLLPQLSTHNLGLATQIATIPNSILGFGHIKEASMLAAKAKVEELVAQFHSQPPIDVRAVA